MSFNLRRAQTFKILIILYSYAQVLMYSPDLCLHSLVLMLDARCSHKEIISERCMSAYGMAMLLLNAVAYAQAATSYRLQNPDHTQDDRQRSSGITYYCTRKTISKRACVTN